MPLAIDGQARDQESAPADADEAWSTERVAEYLGITRDSARRQLQRWRITPVGRELETGQKLWPAHAVIEAHQNRPGQGYRSDLRGKPRRGPGEPRGEAK